MSDTLNHRIQRFTRDGKHIQTIDNGNGSADGELNMPWGVAVDETGRRIYVADWRNDRVQKVLRRWRVPAQHRLIRRSKGPVQQARGGCGRCDMETSTSPTGSTTASRCSPRKDRFVEQFIGDANLSRSGRQYILANATTLRLREMTDLEPTRRLHSPCAVRVDSEFRLFICDFGQHRIQVYKKEAYELSESDIIPRPRNNILFTT